MRERAKGLMKNSLYTWEFPKMPCVQGSSAKYRHDSDRRDLQPPGSRPGCNPDRLQSKDLSG